MGWNSGYTHCMLPSETYAPRIKRLRLARGEVQATLATALGVSRSHLTNIENGKDSASLETLVAIALHYGISLDWLIRGVEPGSPMVLSLQEHELLRLYRELPPQARENALKLFQMAANLAGMQEEDRRPTEG